jgi:dihydroxy-acid dehydratase
VQIVWDDLRPRQILTPDAVANAVMVLLAVGGSINTVKHLQALAWEARCPVDVYQLFGHYSEIVPLLCAVRPNGEQRIEAFEAAGGTLAVLKRLEPMLFTDVPTVAGRSLRHILEDVPVRGDDVILPLDRPVMRRRTIVVLSGSLAPEGALAKLGPGDRPLRLAGPAKVYESQEQAFVGLRGGEVQPGQVVVIRGLGPKGRPGMGMVSSFAFALDGAGLSARVAVVTDGQISGLLNRGLVVAEVSPEAAAGGPLAWVQDGDTIVVDVEARRLDLDVPEDTLARRRRRRKPAEPAAERGWLQIYRRLVRPLREGAVLVE